MQQSLMIKLLIWAATTLYMRTLTVRQMTARTYKDNLIYIDLT